MTKSDATLKKEIAALEKSLALCEANGWEWTANILREKIKSVKRELAKPRKERAKYEIW